LLLRKVLTPRLAELLRIKYKKMPPVALNCGIFFEILFFN